MTIGNQSQSQAEKRNLLSSFFVGLLLALAYEEMINPVRTAVRSEGVTLGTAVLFTIFILTTLRFFIGAILHLISDRLLKLPGIVWFYDFIVIVIEMTIMVFLGGLTTVSANQGAAIDFVRLLILLFIVDIVWIGSQWIIPLKFRSWQRDFIPWGWAILNTILVLSMILLPYTVGDFYTKVSLFILAILNVGAFVVDVILIDHYKVL